MIRGLRRKLPIYEDAYNLKIEKILGGEAMNTVTGEALFKFDPTTATITEETLYNIVERHDKIYSLMYSPQRVYWKDLQDQIIEIKTSELEWSKDNNTFFYIWGWPGPDYNRYDFDTYGKGWAFTKEEIIKAWEEEI